MNKLSSKLFENLKKNELSNLHSIVGGRDYGSVISSKDVATGGSVCDKWVSTGDSRDVHGFMVPDGGKWIIQC